jgi:hypothetical protein
MAKDEDFEVEEKRKIKKEFHEPVEHFNMHNEGEE